MEIFRWKQAGVYVADFVNKDLGLERGRLLNTTVGAVRITNNYIHDNDYVEEGYGVVVKAGAYALIDRNVFDANRHAIAGGSRDPSKSDYSGYTARENLVLAGGGRACNWAGCWRTHQFDMHGTGNTVGPLGSKQCGTAGETIVIERNTFLYDAGPAIKIRGNPTDKATVDGNVFRRDGRVDAIKQNGSCGLLGDNISNPIDVRPNNTYRAKPMDELGSCDFDGDNAPDGFMATGVTWWARHAATGQWHYLNTMSERLAQLELGKSTVMRTATWPCGVAAPGLRRRRSGTPRVAPARGSPCWSTHAAGCLPAICRSGALLANPKLRDLIRGLPRA